MIDHRAGKYRDLWTVRRLKSTIAPDVSGHVNESDENNWENWGTLWCFEDTKPGRESLTGDQLTAASRSVLQARYSSKSVALTTSMKLKRGSRVVSVATPPVDVDGQRKEVEFSITEIK